MADLDRLLDCAPCFYLSFGDDGRITLANATLLERLGYARDELVGRHVETILTRAGRLFYQTHVFPMVKMHGKAQEVFLLVETKDGEQIGTLWNAARRPLDEPVSIDCVVMEVHERRKYEEALLRAKRSAEEANALLEQERTIARDAQQAADTANRAKSEFLATMSHELRTPLNAIGGYADLLATGIYGQVAEAQRHALDRIIRSQRHLLGLINDILNLSRIEAGRVEYAITNVRLSEVVGELRAMIEPQVAANGLRFDVAVDDALVLRADHEKTVQILLNLLSNAVKFTASGGAVALRTRRRAGSDARVAIEVVDTGRGIPADKIEAVFEPFVQVRSSKVSTSEGTGLGLAISRNLARGMGGDLTATSEVGAGSTFVLTLPAENPESS
jgi:PAS domain S-box-containing protein